MRSFPIFLLLAAVPVTAAEFDWKVARPEAVGMSAERLDALQKDLAGRGTKALLVIRRDTIVLEWYADGVTAKTKQGTASLAKSLVGGMSLAAAMTDGHITPDTPAASLVPAWKDDPRKAKITVAHLATHTSGISDAEEAGKPHDQLTGWKGDFWKRKPDPFTISRDAAPVLFEPGEKVAYSNPGMAMLSYAITAALAKAGAPQKDVRALLRERVMRPIGIADAEWSCGYGQTYAVDGLDLVANWGGGAFTPRAAARLGRLMLREGDWDGKRVLGQKVVRTMLDYKAAQTPGWSGDASPQPVLCWYTNVNKTWPGLPRDTFAGAGAGHELLLVVPSLDLIVVRNGSALAARGREGFWAAAERFVFAPAVGAVVDPPLKASDTIRAVEFDPVESILRKAVDSDNWPLTWADDGALYTSYGDGRGFDPPVGRKLSLGLAKVEGTPPEFAGSNLRAPGAEREGDGAGGPKASGMLMVDGVLYMWVRNVGNSQLAWSEDHGKTWTWGFKLDTSFGCPTFLNFGQNYAGAADDYVYTYSQDGPTAYEPYDGVVLARVPKAKMRERAAYEFFVRIDEAGKATWTSDVARRGPVVAWPGKCERLDVVHNPGLGVYLMTVGHGHGKGWALLDAKAPWGPWTVAFDTPDWGLGDTHGYRLTGKWMSDGGTRLWLVFSGRRPYDAFCVRGMTLRPYPKGETGARAVTPRQ